MATSLLKLGRLGSLKCLQQDSWVTLRTPFTAAFCTKAGDTKKPAKKTKASSKTLEAPDERAALLAFKTTVAFPTRISTPGTENKSVALDPVVAVGADAADTLGEAAFTRQAESASTNTDSPDAKGDGPEATSTAKASTGREEPVASALGSAAPKDQEATSTSSSESDSDSDSDSDDEKTDTTKTVVQPGGEAAEEEKAPTATSEESASVKTTPAPEHVTASAVNKKAAEVSAEAGSKITEASLAEARHESFDAPSVKSVATGGREPGVEVEPPLETSQDSAAMKVTAEASTKAPDHLPQVGPSGHPDAVLKATPEVPPDSAEEGASEAKVEAAPQTLGGTVAEAVATEASLTEELTDPAPVLTDKADPPADPEAVPAPEEPVPPPEPEPFDNTTYKNLQHHSYNTFTFADMDMELAQHRLPQPSTGRPSPMH